MRAALVLMATLLPTTTNAQDICPKYGECTFRAEMFCEATPQSSFIVEACYHDCEGRLFLNLRGTWYAYCNASYDLLEALVTAESPGRFYNERIKVRDGNRQFACN